MNETVDLNQQKKNPKKISILIFPKKIKIKIIFIHKFS